MFKYKILKYSIIILFSIIFLFLLRVIYKPLDISFLNVNSIKFKDYIGKYENIITEKIVLDFDFFKNRIRLDLGSIKLRKYNNNISNINAGSVTAVIKISDLIKKSITFDSINISNGNIDVENIIIDKGKKENFSYLLKEIPVKQINLKNINLNLYKEESRVAVVNNINGKIQKSPEALILDSLGVDYIEYEDDISKNKFIINNLIVSNKYTDIYTIAIDSLDLINAETLTKTKYLKKIKNVKFKGITTNYNVGNKKISLEGNILYKNKISKIFLEGLFHNKTLTETLVKINLKNFPIISLIEDKIIQSKNYSLQNINNTNFNGNIKLGINNNKLLNIDLDIQSIQENSSLPKIINIKDGNNFNITKLLLKANYSNNKIKIHDLKVNSLEGNINLKGDILNIRNKSNYFLKLRLEDFKYFSFMNMVKILYPRAKQYQTYDKLVKDSFIKSLVINVDSREEDLKVTLIQAIIKNTNLEIKENLKLAMPEINIKSNYKNNIIINIKSSKLFNNEVFANLSKTIITLNKYNSIDDIKNNFEVTTNVNTKYNSFYRLISELDLEALKRPYVKNIDGNVKGLLNIRRIKKLDSKVSLLYVFSAKLEKFNLLEESINKDLFINFNNFNGELLADNNGTKIKGNTYINGSMANVNILIDNLNIMTAHINSDAKASSFNFLKEFNYLKSGTNKLNIIITKNLNSKNWIANIESDVFSSDIDLNFINYKKSANTRGTFAATFFFLGDKLTKINNLNFFTDNIIMKGSLYFDNNTKLKKINIEEYINERNNFSAMLRYSKNDKKTMKIKGVSIDLADFIKSDNKNNNNIILALDIDKLFYGDKYFGEATLDTQIKNGLLYNIKGKFLYKGKPYVYFSDVPYKEHKFKKILFKFDDLGLFLNEINLSESFIKGNGDIFFIINKDNLNINSGKIDISDGSIKNASFLARLLQLASFTGLLEILTNEGIPFNKIVGDFTINNDEVNISTLKLKGFSLGGTIEGNIKLNNNKINLEGIIIPAYAINSLINKIPIVGQIVTGIEGKGLIGVNYKARGTINKPTYNINPLSILTPGIIRNIFDVFKTDESEPFK